MSHSVKYCLYSGFNWIPNLNVGIANISLNLNYMLNWNFDRGIYDIVILTGIILASVIVTLNMFEHKEHSVFKKYSGINVKRIFWVIIPFYIVAFITVIIDLAAGVIWEHLSGDVGVPPTHAHPFST